MPDDEPANAAPEPALRIRAATVGPGKPLADQKQQRRQQGERRRHAEHGDEQAGVPHAAQERDRHGDQRGETDRDRDAGEQHGTPGCLQSNAHRIFRRSTVTPLLSPARHDQQGVVDGYTKTDQGQQVLDDERDVGEPGQAPEQEEGRQNRGRRDQQGHQRQERSEDQRQHNQRADPAEQRLDQRATPGIILVETQRVPPGHRDRHVQLLRDLCGHRPQRLQRGRVGLLGRNRNRIHQHDAGLPVARQQVRAVRIGRDPGPLQRLPHSRRDRCRAVLGHRSRSVAHHQEHRRIAPARPQRLQNVDVGLVPRLPRQAEVEAQPVHGPRRGEPPERRQQHPHRDHPPASRDHQAGQGSHRCSSASVDGVFGVTWTRGPDTARSQAPPSGTVPSKSPRCPFGEPAGPTPPDVRHNRSPGGRLRRREFLPSYP